MKPDHECECHDVGCTCAGQCHTHAVTTLFRIDMDDWTGTRFCQDCADDAAESGCFVSAEDLADEDLRS